MSSEAKVKTITLSNVAAREGVSRQTIRRWVEKGQYPKPIHGADKTNRTWRFSKEAIEKIHKI